MDVPACPRASRARALPVLRRAARARRARGRRLPHDHRVRAVLVRRRVSRLDLAARQLRRVRLLPDLRASCSTARTCSRTSKVGRRRARTFWKRRFFRIFPAYWVAAARALPGLPAAEHPDVPRRVHRVRAAAELPQRVRVLRHRRRVDVGGRGELLRRPAVHRDGAARAGRARRRRSRAKLRMQLIGLAVMYVIAIIVPGLRARTSWTRRQRTGATGWPRRRINWWLIGFLDWFALGMLLAVASAWAALGGRCRGSCTRSARTRGCAGCSRSSPTGSWSS